MELCGIIISREFIWHTNQVALHDYTAGVCVCVHVCVCECVCVYVYAYLCESMCVYVCVPGCVDLLQV